MDVGRWAIDQITTTPGADAVYGRPVSTCTHRTYDAVQRGDVITYTCTDGCGVGTIVRVTVRWGGGPDPDPDASRVHLAGCTRVGCLACAALASRGVGASR